jgi:hypothetical protein
MPDGYVNPDNIVDSEEVPVHQAAPGNVRREQSKIQFPYFDLDSAISVARVMRDKAGGALFTKDQLAAALDQSVVSGSFLSKVNAASMFGLVELTTSGARVTQLGFEILDANETRVRAARVEAFLKVPLYKRTFEEYRGKQLPPRPHGLEQAFAGFGVGPKRTENARWAFDRSARQAGFYEHGDDRLIAPVIAEPPQRDSESVVPGSVSPPIRQEITPVQSPKRALHPFIEGLLLTLPEPGEKWDALDQANWLEAAAKIFRLIYKMDGEVEIRAKSNPTQGTFDFYQR